MQYDRKKIIAATEYYLSVKDTAKWQERNAKIAASLKGKQKSDAHRKKLAQAATKRVGKDNPFYGKHLSDTAKASISKSNSKQVIMHDIDSNADTVFNSIQEAISYIRSLGYKMHSRLLSKIIINHDIFLNATWTLIDNGHAKPASTTKYAINARQRFGTAIIMYNDSSLIKFDSIRAAATYVIENKLDTVSFTNVRRKIGLAIKNQKLLYNFNWKVNKV